MNSTNRSFRIGIGNSRHTLLEPPSYQAIVSGLLSEMARLIRSTETRTFSPPFKLVIIDNRGAIVFSGQVGRNGKLRQSGPACRIRRSHFPANALITDGSLAVRTFRIDRPAPRTFCR